MTGLPTTIRTDVVSRWLMARTCDTPAAVASRIESDEAGEPGTVRPGPDILRWETTYREGVPHFGLVALGGQPPALTDAWLALDMDVHVIGSRDDGSTVEAPKVLVTGMILPHTVASAAAGLALGDVLDHPGLGALARATIAFIDVQTSDLRIHLDPQWIVETLPTHKDPTP